MRGRAHTFGDNVNTDEITPSKCFGESLEVQTQHLFEPIKPDFGDRIQEGDIIIAGDHFGSGSNRITAPLAIRESGVAVVVAESFARIFYRNAIAIGFPVVICDDVCESVSDGDVVQVDLRGRMLRNLTTDAELTFEPIPEAIRSIFDAGGLIEHYKRQFGESRREGL